MYKKEIARMVSGLEENDRFLMQLYTLIKCHVTKTAAIERSVQNERSTTKDDL